MDFCWRAFSSLGSRTQTEGWGQDQQNNQKIRGEEKKNSKKKYYMCEEIGKCDT